MSQRPRNPIIQMLCIDQKTGEYSNTKLWSNVASLILCVAFVHQVWDSSASTELYLVFGGLLLANRQISKYLGQKKEEPNVSS